MSTTAGQTVANTIESWRLSTSTPDTARNALGTSWPSGLGTVPHSELKILLASSARWNARTAIDKYVERNIDQLLHAAVACGTAVELLVKAYFAAVSHSLLADRGDKDSVLLLEGRPALARCEPTRLKSISASEALAMMKAFHKTLPINPSQSKALQVRNSAAHMALLSYAELEQGITEMVRIIEGTLPLLQLDPQSFWGSNRYQAVTSVLDKSKTAIAKSVAAKMAAARERLDKLLADLPPNDATLLLNALSGRLIVSGDHDEGQECPVCEQKGWLLCTVELGPVGYDKDSMTSGPEEIAYPTDFECPVCQLELSGDELQEFDFPLSIVVADSEYKVWEPDEDRHDRWDY